MGGSCVLPEQGQNFSKTDTRRCCPEYQDNTAWFIISLLIYKIFAFLLKLFVLCLTIMGQSRAFCQFHVCKHSTERRIFRTVIINAKPDCTLCFMEVEDTHLTEDNSIFLGTLNAETIFLAAQTRYHFHVKVSC